MNKKAIVGVAAGGVLVGTALVVYLGVKPVVTLEVELESPEAQAAPGDTTTVVSSKQDNEGVITAHIKTTKELPNAVVRDERMTRQQILDGIAADEAGLVRCQVQFDACTLTYSAQKAEKEAVLFQFDAAALETAP